MYRKTLVILLLNLSLLPASAFQDSGTTLLKKLTGVEAIKGNIKLTERYTQESREVAAEYLLTQVKNFVDEVEIASYSKRGRNVVAQIKATTDTDEWVVFGAHYDTVRNSPGANDNASGIALVYEVAKYMTSLETRKKNIYIVFFDEEERGLVGSRSFAKSLKKRNVNLHSAHTVDQLGWDKDGDRAIELEMPHEDLGYHYENVAKLKEFYAPIYFTKVTSTDHQAFRELGYPAIGLTEEYKNHDTTPHYHKPSDTFDTINLDYLKSTTQYMKWVFEALLLE